MIAILLSYGLAACCPLVQLPDDRVESLGMGVLVMDSGTLYEGRIDRVGKLFRVMSGGRTEMIRDVNVVFTGQTKEDAFDFLRTKKKSESAEDAAKLADWCLKNGLPRQAVEEARSAAKLAPDNRAYAKLVKDCDENARKAAVRPVIRVVGTGVPPATTVPTAAPPLALPAMPGAGAAKPLAAGSGELEVTFAKTVQPVLMNLCVNCHADQTRAASFRLMRIPEGIIVSPKTGENLTAAMNQLSRERTDASPLLVFALTPHGGRTTPLLTRQSAAFQNLETWAASAVKSLPAKPAKPADVIAVSAPVVPVPANPTANSLPVAAPAKVVPSLTKPVDPFDPAEFNKSAPKK